MTSKVPSPKLGGDYDKDSRYMDLTILTGVSPGDKVMQEEIFGPILPIINVDSPSDAVDFINGREKPLTLYVYSEDKKIQVLKSKLSTYFPEKGRSSARPTFWCALFGPFSFE